MEKAPGESVNGKPGLNKPLIPIYLMTKNLKLSSRHCSTAELGDGNNVDFHHTLGLSNTSRRAITVLQPLTDYEATSKLFYYISRSELMEKFLKGGVFDLRGGSIRSIMVVSPVM